MLYYAQSHKTQKMIIKTKPLVLTYQEVLRVVMRQEGVTHHRVIQLQVNRLCSDLLVVTELQVD